MLMAVVAMAHAGDVFTFTFNGGKATSEPAGYFSFDPNGKSNFNSKFKDCEYDGVKYSNGLKMEGSTKILFTTTVESIVTIVQSNWSANTIALDGEELAIADAEECTGGRVYTITGVAAGEHNITRVSGESGLFLVKVEYTAEDTTPQLTVAPDAITLNASPLARTRTATFSVMGKNLADGTYNLTVPAVTGLSVEPASFTVTSGAASQEFTVSYTSEADVAQATADIVATVGEISDKVTVTYKSRANAYEQTAVSEAASWDWETLTETVTLSETTVPSINDDFVFQELEDQIKFGTFDAKSIVISKTQYPVRSKKLQNGTIKFNTTVDGVITVDFSDTGSSIGDGTVERYLNVNGKNTEYYTMRDGSSSDRKVSGEIPVYAGEVAITGCNAEGVSTAICIYKVTFTPKELPAPTSVEIDMTDAIADEAGYLKTFSCQYDLDFSAVEGIKAFVGTKSYDDYGAISKLNLQSIDVVPAGTGVLLKADEAKAYTVAIPEFVFVEEFTNDLAVAETDIDLNEAVKTDSWGDFISGPAILAKGTVMTGVTEDWEAIYGEATGFFVADPDTDKLLAGDVYLPVAEGEWDSWGAGYVKLTFTDQMSTYATIGALTATPVHEDGYGVLAALEWEGITADVDWTNGSYMFVKDYTGGLLMQVPEGLTVKAGDIIFGSYTGNYTNVLFPQLLVADGITDASSLMVLDNMGEPTPEAVSLADAFDESSVMRMVKLSNLKMVVKKGTYSSDYYIQDAEGTEAYLNDAFGIAEKQIEGLETGDAIAEMVGVAFIIPEGSPYLTYYNYDQYEFIPLSITGITTGISELKADQAEAPVYSLSGMRVNKAQKGIFIQNGRKVVK